MLKKMDYVMIIFTDMNRSVEFYRDNLGIPLKFQSEEWGKLDSTFATCSMVHAQSPIDIKGATAADIPGGIVHQTDLHNE
jgi:carbonic anhydrase